MITLRFGLVTVLVLFASGCFNPVDDDLVAEQGPEVDGVGEGPLHRYGQKCFACHGGSGIAPEMAFAGTVFAVPNEDIPVAGATITITDANGDSRSTPSNCAGNFYVLKEAWDPVYPLRAEIECTLPNGETRRSLMGTRINRDGGCASCHERGEATFESPGQVYCLPEQPDPPFTVAAGCEGGPHP